MTWIIIGTLAALLIWFFVGIFKIAPRNDMKDDGGYGEG